MHALPLTMLFLFLHAYFNNHRLISPIFLNSILLKYFGKNSLFTTKILKTNKNKYVASIIIIYPYIYSYIIYNVVLFLFDYFIYFPAFFFNFSNAFLFSFSYCHVPAASPSVIPRRIKIKKL